MVEKKNYEYWYKTIGQYDRAFKKWENRADRIVKKYRDYDRTQNNPNARTSRIGIHFDTGIPTITH